MKVGQFLVETWQMFYWSFFCPSRLQKRMNETNLFTQYSLITIILSLPLAVLVASSGRGWDFRVWFASNLISYALGFWFLPAGIGFCSPLILALIYWQQAELFTNAFEFKSAFLFAIHVLMSVPRDLKVVISIFVIGFTTVPILNGVLILALLIALSTVILMAICYSFGIAITLAICSISLPCFLLASALLAFGCTPFRQKWLGIWIAAICVVLGWGDLSFNALFAIPVSLIVYYRIFPDYSVAYLVGLVYRSLQKLLELSQDNFLTSRESNLYRETLNNIREILRQWFEFNQDNFITKLPPYTSELMWLSLSNYQHIFIDTFNRNPDLGLATYKTIEAISLPGFQATTKKALPSIVANRYAAIRTTAELIDLIKPSHPLLPSLIPKFYQPDRIMQLAETPMSGNSEIDLLVPLFKQIAKDTIASIKAGSSALKERGLERLVDRLKILPAQLPGLGLNPKAVKRWQPAIEQWQNILELEIAEQQKTSQGELFNPFQFGNPLRPDRATIFKGRQNFADQLVRLILDRNRPTLVLHGSRRAGKTSFLLNLPHLLPSDLIPIYLDMQQASMTNSEGDFCYGLVRAIQRDTRSQGLQIPSLPSRQDFITQPYTTLEDWLDSALSQLGERRLLLNLDEFEKIGSAIKEQRISDRLFDQLRSMIQHDDRLGFLFSGVQTLEELGPRWSNYFISVVPMEMHYLEPAEAEDLLLNPLRSRHR
jgi:hypothetical protein